MIPEIEERGGLMEKNILEVLEKQSEIIKLQSEIIDRIALELLQNGMITEVDLRDIKKAAILQEEIKD